MKITNFKKIIAIVLAVSVIMAMGIIAYADNVALGENPNGRSSVWNTLTDEQKTQLTSQAKARLADDLADGKITQERYDEIIKAIDNNEMPMFGKGSFGGKDSRYALRDEQNTKWNALTEQQKSEIYSIYQDKTNVESKIIDKYLEFGVIDKETADTMKENLQEQQNNMKNSGRMPMLRGGRGFCPR